MAWIILGILVAFGIGVVVGTNLCPKQQEQPKQKRVKLYHFLILK